jgi:hypothetical protein
MVTRREVAKKARVSVAAVSGYFDEKGYVIVGTLMILVVAATAENPGIPVNVIGDARKGLERGSGRLPSSFFG